MTPKEQKIYNNAGGGKKGEAAVKSYNDYLEEFAYRERQYGREVSRQRYLPRNEKITGTVVMSEDDYDN